MPRAPSLSSMSVDALLKLRDDIGKVLSQKAFSWRTSSQSLAARWAVDGAAEEAGSFSRSQTGCAPRPAQVLPCLCDI